MTTYLLANGVTVTSANPTLIVSLPDPLPAVQTFNIEVTGNATLTAKVQIVASTEDPNTLPPTGAPTNSWTNYGALTTVTGGASSIAPITGYLSGTTPWKSFGAVVNTLSGTAATVYVKMIV